MRALRPGQACRRGRQLLAGPLPRRVRTAWGRACLQAGPALLGLRVGQAWSALCCSHALPSWRAGILVPAMPALPCRCPTMCCRAGCCCAPGCSRQRGCPLRLRTARRSRGASSTCSGGRAGGGAAGRAAEDGAAAAARACVVQTVYRETCRAAPNEPVLAARAAGRSSPDGRVNLRGCWCVPLPAG